MIIDSTESAVERRQGDAARLVAEPAGQGVLRGVSRAAWLVASAAIMIEAALLRLYDLGLKPLHHDEGVNGSFLIRLFRDGFYRYDPANYHGPTLYYAGLVSSYLFGLNTVAIRIVPAAFGIGTVWLALHLRRSIGDIGALVTAALIAVSPGAVYFSRYFIHESMFVFFTLGLVVATLRYNEERGIRRLLVVSACAALLFATKETALVSVAVLTIAACGAAAYWRVRRRLRGQSSDYSGAQTDPSHESLLSNSLIPTFRSPALRRWLVAAGLFVCLAVLFYSSFFTNPRGPTDALKSFQFWVRTGTGQHVYPWYQYLKWLVQEESPLLVLGGASILLSLWGARSRFGVFASLWAIGVVTGYSLLPYKTPWLALSLVVPLAIASGHAFDMLSSPRKASRPRRLGMLLLGAAAVTVSLVQAVSLSFFHFDDDRYPYVYAHTEREFLGLVTKINELAAVAATGRATTIAVTSPDYWPLPWYLRHFSRVGYYGKVVQSSDAIVVGSEQQEQELERTLGSGYRRVDTYPLRPGAYLVLYLRIDALQR